MTAKPDSPDIGVGLVTNTPEVALVFWRDTLGMTELGEVSFPGIGRLLKLGWGNALFRVFVPEQAASLSAAMGGFACQTGLRYVIMTVTNLKQVVEEVRAGGYPVAFEPKEIRPGMWVAQIEDGEGTTVELQQLEVAQ